MARWKRRRSLVPLVYTTGDDFLMNMNGNLPAVKKARWRYALLIASLGGEGNLSYQQMSLARRAIHAEMLIEGWEEMILLGQLGAVPLNWYSQMVGQLNGIWRTLGVERQQRELSLSDYLEGEANEDKGDSA